MFGVSGDQSHVEEGLGSLLLGGFRDEDISVLFLENYGTIDFTSRKNTKRTRMPMPMPEPS